MLKEVLENLGKGFTVEYSVVGVVKRIQIKQGGVTVKTYYPESTNPAYDNGGIRIVNGKALIQQEKLYNDLKHLGIKKEQLVHKAGDKFSKQDDAALAFALMYHNTSLQDQQEYGAVIAYDSAGKYYSFVNVTNSTETAAKFNLSIDNFRNEVVIDRNNMPTGFRAVASIHTHWDPNGSLEFSLIRHNDDYFGDYVVETLNSMYLVNRDGEVRYTERSASNNYASQYYGFPEPPNKVLFKVKK
jgi:hypothetical protein